MSRPEFPNCIMPPQTISRIRQEQDCYDENPERYERQQCEQQQQEYREQLLQEQMCREQEFENDTN